MQEKCETGRTSREGSEKWESPRKIGKVGEYVSNGGNINKFKALYISYLHFTLSEN